MLKFLASIFKQPTQHDICRAANEYNATNGIPGVDVLKLCSDISNDLLEYDNFIYERNRVLNPCREIIKINNPFNYSLHFDIELKRVWIITHERRIHIELPWITEFVSNISTAYSKHLRSMEDAEIKRKHAEIKKLFPNACK